jgi:hypothetical protein
LILNSKSTVNIEAAPVEMLVAGLLYTTYSIISACKLCASGVDTNSKSSFCTADLRTTWSIGICVAPWIKERRVGA